MLSETIDVVEVAIRFVVVLLLELGAAECRVVKVSRLGAGGSSVRALWDVLCNARILGRLYEQCRAHNGATSRLCGELGQMRILCGRESRQATQGCDLGMCKEWTLERRTHSE